MKLPEILVHPHPILRRKATEISLAEIGSSNIQTLIKTMRSVLAASEDGIGLAAPQIGHSVRLFLVSEEALAIDRGENAEPKDGKKKIWNALVFINPVIKKFSGKKTDMVEGCLSVPGIYGMVRRPEKIDVEWHDEEGKKHSRGCSKFFARVIQHETDHINGVLFTDKMLKEVKLEGEKNRL